MSFAPRGIHPMLYAFFDDRGELRLDAFDRQVDAAVATGAHGIAVLGLGTEVGKLTPPERLQVVKRVVSRAGGKLPVAVTVAGPSVEVQVEFAHAAIGAGANWLLLQPPAASLRPAELEAFFGQVFGRVETSVGVQNAPQFLGTGLDASALARLALDHPNFRVVKLECSAVDLEATAATLGNGLALLNGRCGLELPDNLRAGAVGMIPGIETIDRQVAVYQAYEAGDEGTCETRFSEFAPVLSSIMQGIDHFVVYGKLLAALRLGISYGGTRSPNRQLTHFGAAVMQRFADRLGPLPA